MARPVVIAGVGVVPFRKPGSSDTYDIMGANAARAALADAGIDYDQVGQAYAAFVHADSCAGQAALYHVGMTGIPVMNVNNMCASGSSAFYLAAQAVSGGAVDCALAVGFEEMARGAIERSFPQKASPLDRHVRALTGLFDITDEELRLPEAVLLFALQAEVLTKFYGVTEEALALVAVKARRHAANNPIALYREPLTVEQILAQPTLYRGLRKLYACPPTSGAASAIVCSEAFAKAHGVNTGVRLLAAAAISDRAEYFSGEPIDIAFRALGGNAARQAYEQAALGPDDIDVIELHDCFVSNEIIAYNALGLCPIEDLDRFVRDGENTYGGKVVVCPSGGLLSKGHPLGATGLAQIAELTWQLRGQAGARQVEGARTALQQNVGMGSASFVHILQAD
ncbi:MAG: lipid-transfer protein [Gammaproteobacteria bacterium]|nr:MAG: lipid-transfer protein [Gammaproteobacteria bacterium]